MALPRPRPPRPDVPVEHQADIVEVVVAPHPFMTGAIRQPDRPIVVTVVGHLAPAERYRNRLQHQSATTRRRWPVLAEIAGQHPQPAERRGAVAFALARAGAAAAERAR